MAFRGGGTSGSVRPAADGGSLDERSGARSWWDPCFSTFPEPIRRVKKPAQLLVPLIPERNGVIPDSQTGNVDVDAVRCFLLVAELGSFTLAAERLGLSQSAVSKQVRRLEEAGGRALLTRRDRVVRLTPEGEVLLPYALGVGRSVDDLALALREPPLTGTVRLGIAEDIAAHDLPRRLGAFRQRHPLVRLTIETGLSGLLSDRLARGEFDLVMGKRPSFRQQARIVAAEPLHWAGAPAFPRLHKQRPLPLALYPDPSVTADIVTAALRQAGIKAVVVVTSASITGLRAGILAGLAIGAFGRAFMPPGLVAIGDDAGLPPLGPLQFGIERRDGALSAAAEALADELAREQADAPNQPIGAG